MTLLSMRKVRKVKLPDLQSLISSSSFYVTYFSITPLVHYTLIRPAHLTKVQTERLRPAMRFNIRSAFLIGAACSLYLGAVTHPVAGASLSFTVSQIRLV